jgi:hypothetical protein
MLPRRTSEVLTLGYAGSSFQRFLASSSSSYSYSYSSSSSNVWSSFTADGSEYSSSNDDMDYDDVSTISSSLRRSADGTTTTAALLNNNNNNNSDDDTAPTIELQPVPVSKNTGNRFVAFIWDRDIAMKQHDSTTSSMMMQQHFVDTEEAIHDRHLNRIALTEDHVSTLTTLTHGGMMERYSFGFVVVVVAAAVAAATAVHNPPEFLFLHQNLNKTQIFLLLFLYFVFVVVVVITTLTVYCRKQNLYNETFNTESMVDILWSHPM